jgi:apolipoprotein N-acyltransferase
MNFLSLDTRSKRLAAALVSGVMLHFVLGLTPWWPMAWLAPIPLLLAAFQASASESRLLYCVAAGLGLASNVTYYIKTTGPFATVILMVLQVLAWGLIMGLTKTVVLKSKHWLTVFAYPLHWAALGTLIHFFSPHGAWGSLAYTQSDALAVIQIASLAGTPGVVFLVSLLASTIAIAAYRGLHIEKPWLAYGIPVVVLLSSLIFGVVRLVAPNDTPKIPVGLASIDDFIGPGIPASVADTVWRGYDDAVVQLAKNGARIVVLPEKIATLDPAAANEKCMHLASLARVNGVYLVAGFALHKDGHTDNAAWLFDPSGQFLGEYHKQHLVPYLEADETPGNEDVVRSVDAHRIGIVICRDLLFPSLSRRYARQDVTALLVPAWDFYRDRWMASRVAIMRGVESGYSVVRCGREGLLVMSDACGRVIAETGSSSLPGATLLANTPFGPGKPTFYARYGDVFGWLCVGLSILTWLRFRLTRRF